MQILIVDDEELARSRLQRLLEGIPHCTVIGQAQNGDEALEKIQQLDPDLVFLDIRMPGKGGMDVAKILSEWEYAPAVVFCTAYDEYALDAFNTLAVGYIVKPVVVEQLEQAIQKCQRITRVQHLTREKGLGDTRKHISARTRKGIELVAIKSIQCFVADQKYVTAIHDGGELLIDETLKELEEEFGDVFIRVHRNALVSVSKIEALERDDSGPCLRLNATDYRPSVSRRHLPQLRSLLARI